MKFLSEHQRALQQETHFQLSMPIGGLAVGAAVRFLTTKGIQAVAR